MNKTMKKMLAGLLAVCCVPVAGMTAAAKDLDMYWGTVTWEDVEALEGAERINSHGWFKYVYLKDLDTVHPSFIIIHPRERVIRFVLREGVEYDAIADLMEQFREDMDAANLYMKHNEEQNMYELEWRKVPENADALEAGLLRDLAKNHLISEFYGFGGTADYSYNYFGDVLSGYGDEPVSYDWDGAQAYLDAHHPGCRVEVYDHRTRIVERYEDGTIETESEPLYRIVTPDEMTVRERFELACELSDFHITPNVAILESDNPSVTGRNLLAKQGDVTLDTELSIIDVIALNKNLMTGEPLCDTAKKNADINGNGTPDEADSLAILKEIIELTHDFEEPEKG